MKAWEAFVANQRNLVAQHHPNGVGRGLVSAPKLINIDLQPYQTVQPCERADIMNSGGFSDSVFNVISAFLADNNQRIVAEVEATELETRFGLGSNHCLIEAVATPADQYLVRG